MRKLHRRVKNLRENAAKHTIRAETTIAPPSAEKANMDRSQDLSGRMKPGTYRFTKFAMEKRVPAVNHFHPEPPGVQSYTSKRRHKQARKQYAAPFVPAILGTQVCNDHTSNRPHIAEHEAEGSRLAPYMQHHATAKATNGVAQL